MKKQKPLTDEQKKKIKRMYLVEKLGIGTIVNRAKIPSSKIHTYLKSEVILRTREEGFRLSREVKSGKKNRIRHPY